MGKLKLLAIGGRKIQSKLSGLLEPFNELRVMLADGKVYDRVGQAVGLDNFLSASGNDWKKNWSLHEVSNFLDKILPEKQVEKKIYQLFKKFLFLNRRRPEERLSILFKWQTAILSGFTPLLEACAVCGVKLKAARKISISKGGVVCEKCSSSFNDLIDLSLREEAILRHLISHSAETRAWIKINEKEDQFLEKLFNKFYSYHLLK